MSNRCTDAKRIRAFVLRHLPEAERFLCEMIRIPSLSGHEKSLMPLLERRFSAIGLAVERIPLRDAIRNDPDYSSPLPDIRYNGRYNLRILRKGAGKGRSLIVNTHTDVVPISLREGDSCGAIVSGGRIKGPGACDAKGQIAALYLLLKSLNECAVPPMGDIEIHLVVEEENGGNGTLAMVRRGFSADGCIVMEPTEMRVCTSVRGALWFRLAVRGRSGHSSQVGRSRSALATAREAMAAMEEFHRRLVGKSQDVPLFDRLRSPMPLTFGKLQSGIWPAAIPENALVEGVIGFLPNFSKEQVCKGMRDAVRSRLGKTFKDCSLTFTYRHDGSVLDPTHELPVGLLKAGRVAGSSLKIAALPASCDAWLYRNHLRIPTVVFGPGSLGVAHSPSEFIVRKDLARAGAILAAFLLDYCG
ncbi:MAG: hypothetical protein A2Z34_02965 [Planctomycetes bacterium RBG_16_59_8]|nr:MAG: hypothetical protein A2Z34_02965 [Planctomycetes bacterium RBG_16_59_8]